MKQEGARSGWFDQLGLADRALENGSRRPALARDDRENVRRVAAAGLIILVLLGPIMTFGGINLTSDGSVERQIGYIVVLGLAIYGSFPVMTRFSLIALPIPIVLALCWCWVSLTWAIDPDASLRRLVLTTTVAWTIFILVRHTRYTTMIDVLRWTLVGSIALSYVVVFLDPVVGIHTMADASVPTALIGNWRGFLGHKNFAGAVCALSILLFVFDAKRFSAMVRIGVIVLVGYFLFRTQSKTSVGMLVMAMLGGVMFETLSRRLRAYLIPIVTVLGSLLWTATSAYGDFLTSNLLNPTAFTGRGHIWSTLLRYSADHPLLGAGFGSFWNIGTRSPVFVYGQGYVTEITVGHSGYIDQLVSVGIPGVLLMVFAAMIWPFWKLLSAPHLSAPRGALIASVLMFCIGHNVTESGLFERDAIVSSLLFFAVAFAQYRAGAPHSKRASSQDRDTGDALLRAMRKRNTGTGGAARGTDGTAVALDR